jgi:hypothetical protein
MNLWNAAYLFRTPAPETRPSHVIQINNKVQDPTGVAAACRDTLDDHGESGADS